MTTRINTRVIILNKGDLFGIISIAVAGEETIVATLDPKKDAPSVSTFNSEAQAAQSAAEARDLSLQGGWRIVYQGPPLRG